MTAALAFDAVSAGYGEQRILSQATLQIAPQETVALLGPSGSGKSTLVRLALGFLVPEAGTVSIHGQVVSEPGEIRVPPEERRLSVVFQDLALWPHLSVHANLTFVLESLDMSGAERRRRADSMLAELSLQAKARRYPGELSGGERQRVAIARALVAEPRVVLLDEPLANLDVHLKRQLLGTFRRLFRERGTTVLFVTHDLREAAALADRIAILEGGRIVREGTLDELRADPSTDFVRSLVADLDWKGAT